MNSKLYLLLVFYLLSVISCKNNHLINDSVYRDNVNSIFLERKKIFSGRNEELFSVFNHDLNNKESEALKFLFAYMPLSDLADYDGMFFLDNVRLSLKACQETEWGRSIPEEIFLHYVLPVRVNNENLDSFRIAYFDEILRRIGDFNDIEVATLEINHWCHEKVSYQPADIRTSSPLATVLSARGRCGEESTFTVAALRTAGIPARQIYTPRWAHSDDNHAWVEVWINGEWKYLGACEPEPVLDRGWFTESARQAMLTHTKAFGMYRGDDNLIKEAKNYSEINTLSKYARTKFITIKVIDSSGNDINEAQVEPRLYNYAEFYPLTEIPTDEYGMCRFETGMGDLLLWARKNDRFGLRKISVAETDTVILTIGTHDDISNYYEFDLQAPIKHTPFPDTLSQRLKIENADRLRKEDSIRHAYISTWMNDQEAADLAVKAGFDTARVKDIIKRSMGNYKEISMLVRNLLPEYGDILLKLLEVISDKDLRDVRVSVIEDHLLNVAGKFRTDEYPQGLFTEYVLNPRISFEIITPWRSFIKNFFEDYDTDEFVRNPNKIADWITENIELANEENYYNVPLSPAGVLKTGYTDLLSRNILFIACCRSYGVPARIEPGTGISQFYQKDKWNDASFNDNESCEAEEAYLAFSYRGGIPVPEYYIHFTLSRFEDGRYNTMNYGYNRKITSFDDYLALPEGKYMLVTGNRTNESTVLSSVRFFDLKGGERKTLEVKLRTVIKPPDTLGLIDLNKNFHSDNIQTKLSTYSDKGLIIIWIDHDKEPSKHVINDIPLVSKELDEIGCQLIFLSDPSLKTASYKPELLNGLPEKTLFGFDEDMSILNSVYGKSISEIQMPYVLYADINGNIFYRSEGYHVGLGEQILKSVIINK